MGATLRSAERAKWRASGAIIICVAAILRAECASVDRYTLATWTDLTPVETAAIAQSLREFQAGEISMTGRRSIAVLHVSEGAVSFQAPIDNFDPTTKQPIPGRADKSRQGGSAILSGSSGLLFRENSCGWVISRQARSTSEEMRSAPRLRSLRFGPSICITADPPRHLDFFAADR